LNIQETLALIEALKASGVIKFKSQEHEIEFNVNHTVNIKKPEVTQELPPETKEATEKLKNLINTISLSPEELANQIFPDGAL
jgi:transcription initiation factor IIE alpha subunit